MPIFQSRNLAKAGGKVLPEKERKKKLYLDVSREE